MRVISGKYKSIKLNSLEGMTTRPTTCKVKESLFNMIDCYNMKILDLFAGSGGLGIEAISRGARHTTFIDGSSLAIKIINSNIKKCNVDNELFNVFKNDYLRSLKIFSKKNEKFDIIFLDPPYKKKLIDSALENIVNLNLCKDFCLIVCEYSSEEKINFDSKKLSVYKEKKYGKINITIFEYREN
ncbi:MULTISPECIES: 16S rRNA (guanine(966)-N(2))-methyltransferase RsmD [unclassified Gemella]|uniref:16S rRNA (guanine(966)-N(2))-methyltransferase RsmD n=1 Tax=unclassified Gemella TaxID=2624949 RepID=UPI001C03EBBA|nr:MULTISPECIES: 16S rRNA (guanine(966)-N(2))-methyltransferase RsmD [unclassified Gemella]MBU0278309.1 16S rRNA (guanine(966)-N(2))-methyltransferase RsmD [Gemella sp. zg-1178]QWQ38186.1 16S rRNA (guanine(966)-N(2))-methyltransferase RsmD [Gemella sp. zg-570]